MGKKGIQLIMVFAFCVTQLQAQITAGLTLDECLKMAKENYPLIKEKELLAKGEQVNIKGINKGWLPKLNLNSQATYQSEVTSLPGFPVVFPKDQYQNVLSVEQNLFDAGTMNEQRHVEHLNAETEIQKNEVEMYKVVDRINQLYCTILLSRENMKILEIYKKEVTNKKTVLSASVQNGLTLESNLNALEAEELKTDQNIIELRENLNALYGSLSLFINKPVDDSVKFFVKAISGSQGADEISRPEMKLFTAQTGLAEARYKLTNKTSLPKLQFFGEGIYGRPGYNFLNQQMRLYGKVGVSLRWNISSLYYRNREKENTVIAKDRIDVQKHLFELNVKTSLLSQDAQIKSLTEIIAKDDEIISKRQKITSTASTQFENGSLTSTDYLTELNSEMQARLNKKVHEVKLMNAESNYATTKGIPNF
jgi:outer membrane protein TolC